MFTTRKKRAMTPKILFKEYFSNFLKLVLILQVLSF